MVELTERHLRELLAKAWSAGYEEAKENPTNSMEAYITRIKDVTLIMSTMWHLDPEDY